jgi:hypothetical protein
MVSCRHSYEVRAMKNIFTLNHPVFAKHDEVWGCFLILGLSKDGYLVYVSKNKPEDQIMKDYANYFDNTRPITRHGQELIDAGRMAQA